MRDGGNEPAMTNGRLNPWTGELASPEEEAAYRAYSTPEVLRRARVLCILSAFVNTGLTLSEFRIADPAIFRFAISARGLAILAAIACFLILRRVTTFAQAERVLVTGLMATAVSAAALITVGNEVGLVAMLLIPTVYYLVVPISFRWVVTCGIVCTLLTVGSYLLFPPKPALAFSIIFAAATLNVFLVTVLSQHNRHGRQEWAAMQSERQARKIQLQSQHLLERTFAAVPIPLVISEIESGRLVRYNEAGIRYFGGEPATFGVTRAQQAYERAEDRAEFMRLLRRDGRVTNFEARLRIGSGEVRTVLMAGAISELDGSPTVVSAIVDITERREAEEKVRHAATHDTLTGLMNRGAFQGLLEKVQHQTSTSSGTVVLLMVDLDSLKEVNDTFGHDAGDALLVETARRLQHLAGDLGPVARLGGDEFVILLSGQKSSAAALDLAETILRDFRQPFMLGERTFASRASIGIAACPRPDYGPGELLKDADLALYAAKNQGRNRAVLYAPSMRDAVMQRVLLRRELSAAVQADAIFPYYQPKFSLVTGQIVGLEALMRWRQGDGVIVPPAKFMSAFDDTELAILMGDSMLRQIARDMQGWLAEGLAFGRVAFNVAPAQFTHPHLAKHLLGIMWDAEVEPRHFEVEITETVFLGRDSEHVAPILDALYEAGVRMALDDFGTGYAALTHLKQLPIDGVKIDRSFVSDLESDPYDSAIVCAVIELGRNLGLSVVAEGVETLTQARFLRERGCEFAQGFFYAHPMPAEAVRALLLEETGETAAQRLAALQH